MKRISGYTLVIIILLVLCPILAGCTESAPAETSTATPSVTTASNGPHYQAGDIVKNPKSSSGAALLIISYDAAADTYERAYIYPNSDGSWGYRLDTKTDKIGRSVIEKVYTDKAGNVAVSAVPVKTPTIAATPSSSVTTTTSASTTTSSTTVTTTTTTGLAPKIKGISPDKGKTGETVSITNLDGQNFVSGAKVGLRKSGETSIIATDVVVSSPILITCKIAIPVGANLGYWDMVVTNPDGQSHQYLNAFLVQEGTTTATTTTTTTSSVASGLVKITQIQDTILATAGLADRKPVTVLGTNLTAVAKMQLVGASTITGDPSLFSCSGSSMATQYFDIPAGKTGTFSVAALDSSGTVLATSSGTLTIQ